MRRHLLAPAEREALDQMMYAAGYDASGKPRPSHEIAVRVVKFLREADDQVRLKWANLLLEDLLIAGAGKYWRGWNRERVVIEIGGKEAVVTKPAAMGIRKRGPGGETYYQLTNWKDMTRDELAQIIDGSNKRIKSERVSIAGARKLLDLLKKAPEASTVLDAARILNVDIAEYLAAAT